MKKTCKWNHTGDGEFSTGCFMEHGFADYDLEDSFQTLTYRFCPYCGGEILFVDLESNA